MRNKDNGLPSGKKKKHRNKKKLIKIKNNLGYCFVEFINRDQAEKILLNYNSKPIPGVQGTFRMNWGKTCKI